MLIPSLSHEKSIMTLAQCRRELQLSTFLLDYIDSRSMSRLYELYSDWGLKSLHVHIETLLYA